MAKDFWFSLGLEPHRAAWLLPMKAGWPENYPLFCFEWKSCYFVALYIYFTPKSELHLGTQRWWKQCWKDSPQQAYFPLLAISPQFQTFLSLVELFKTMLEKQLGNKIHS